MGSEAPQVRRNEESEDVFLKFNCWGCIDVQEKAIQQESNDKPRVSERNERNKVPELHNERVNDKHADDNRDIKYRVYACFGGQFSHVRRGPTVGR